MEVRCRPAVMCCVLAVLCSVARGAPGSSYNDRQYLNEWAVEIPGGLAAVEAIAKELDYHLVRQVGAVTQDKFYLCVSMRFTGALTRMENPKAHQAFMVYFDYI